MSDLAPVVAAPRASPAAARLAALIGLALCVALLGALSIAVGARAVGWPDLLAGLTGGTETIGQAAVALRIPRTLMACAAGAALALSGAIMQGITRNPLADPGILGINNGAALAVVIGIAWFGLASPASFVWLAILGAGITAGFVYAVGSLGRGGATPLKLALAGAATSVAFSSLTLAVVLPRADIAGGVRSWQVGGVGGMTPDRIHLVLPVLLAGFALAMLSARRLNMLALGDEVAAGLGERVAAARAMAALAAIMLCGATTAVCGPIGFVGLVIPHVCRLLLGVDHRWVLPASALGGAALLTASDILGRLVARPAELEVGIVTALIGAPVFIAIVRRHRVRAL
ncbi:FecCD family ABC transporter permease [Paracoccus spongiarum]|uniref:Iron ABC transporter permease n=1 Tax=Paracoccus spongiarum TaxID=3064387 RepID=A0ABT9JBW8_9RHOB|nr:iron ABC transporter permease [Paracoccus sp. 2205BS29-5]MDP5307311.1 iron ABC transporter permease [Paracoccus sp. 2205BS29-5]